MLIVGSWIYALKFLHNNENHQNLAIKTAWLFLQNRQANKNKLYVYTYLYTAWTYSELLSFWAFTHLPMAVSIVTRLYQCHSDTIKHIMIC